MQTNAEGRIQAYEEGETEERTRIVALLRGWADAVAKGHDMAPAAGDVDVERTLRSAADAIVKGEEHPACFR